MWGIAVSLVVALYYLIVMSEPAPFDARDAIGLATELRFRLLDHESNRGGTSQVECDLYRGPADDVMVMHGIKGTREWTDDAARTFVEDVIKAASEEIGNVWFQVLDATDDVNATEVAA